jgi:hypothetical protein
VHNRTERGHQSFGRVWWTFREDTPIETFREQSLVKKLGTASGEIETVPSYAHLLSPI